MDILSTCHWCHVMAHESFEDEEVSKLLNEHFVSIKVDREERPDIDSVYMTVCQALTGHGGWPLSVFLTPEQKPFYAGTYFPKESRYGHPGFMDVLTSIANQYKKDNSKIVASANHIIDALNNAQSDQSGIHENAIEDCYHQLERAFDPQFGGFGDAPKFPAPHQLLFLMRYHRLHKNEQAVAMVVKTLEGMTNGGIHDHIGGGFARYSVDEQWLIPHFEKMLYDQATLMLAYTEAWQVTKNPRFKRVVEDIYTYVTRDMQDSLGGFYSAEDADSEGIEGKFYVWTPGEIFAELNEEEASLYCQVYDITDEGNFEGANLPNLIGTSLEAVASEQKLTEDALLEKLDAINRKLFQVREKRIHPHKDDKILTSWNGLMIAALATASRAFQQPKYLKTAEEVYNFLNQKMFVDGKLFARYRDGEVKVSAFLDDFAYFMWACDALYEASYNPTYLDKMLNLGESMIKLFWDEKHFGFFINQENVSLVMRPKDVYDGAMPSGNSVAAMMLLKLARRTGQIDFEMYVDKMFNRLGAEASRYPMGHAWFLTVYMLARKGTKELVILLPKEESEVPEELQTCYLPEVIVIKGVGEDLRKIASFTKDFYTIGNNVTFYLCEHFQCQQPTNDFMDIEGVLFK